MPELPDVELYRERLVAIAGGQRLRRLHLANPFVLRSVQPRPEALEGRRLEGVRRLGKRLALDLGDGHFAVVHLMIAGRLRWRPSDKTPPGGAKAALARFDFERGTLWLTEAGSQKRASLHVVAGEDALAEHTRGGLEPLESTLTEFVAALRRERHTLKRTLASPDLFSGIGNAYSDEILHAARLSPLAQSTQLDDAEAERLWHATRRTLTLWLERLRAEVGDGFPEDVTAFRPEMAVHGRYRLPCPDCGAAVQRLVTADSEANYCATCQTGGKVLADRAYSRLFHGGQQWHAVATRVREPGDPAPRPTRRRRRTAR